MSSTVDGIVSGLSTSSLIQQLMQAEAAGQTRLKDKVTEDQNAIKALQSVNLKLAAIKTAATAVAKDDTWQLAKATSSSDALVVNAGAGALPGQLSMTVSQLASAQVTTFDLGTDPDAPITDNLAHEVQVTTNSTPPTQTITVNPDTAAGLAAALNAAGLPVRAAVVTADGGRIILQLTSTKTGAANLFTISGLIAGAGTNIAPARDAQLAVGDVVNPGGGGYTVSSASNTFTNVLPNVTLTAVREQANITVAVQQDYSATAAKVQSLVDAANAALTEFDKQSALPVNGTGGGMLAGSPLVRQLSSSLLNAVGSGQTDFGSFGLLGIQLTKDGQLSFDKTKFLSAMQTDPDAVKKALTASNGTTTMDPDDGLANTLTKYVAGATSNIDSSIKSRDTDVRGLQDRISEWDARLKVRQDTLQRQFTAMEVALGQMKDQSAWLASQIAKLG